MGSDICLAAILLQAPGNLKQHPSGLVAYLVQAARSDLEKARVQLRWMGQNIAYDVQYLNGGTKGDNSIEGVLQNGVAVCAGYSDLYKYLCREVYTHLDT